MVAEGTQRVEREEGVRRAGEPAGGAIDAEKMQGADEDIIEYAEAVKKEEEPAAKKE